MAIAPTDYYRDIDTRAITMSDIKRYIDAISNFGRTKGYKVFWRGQANHEWGLVSSLVRQLNSVAGLDDKLLNRVEQSLLSEASKWVSDLGTDTYQHPLAKLAFLQHHGVPTRLIDFTKCPWMSVFFASESHDDIDGRVFAILVPEEDVLTKPPAGTPWRNKYPTNIIKVFDPLSANIVFPRIKVQGGVLALGRLPSTRPHRTAYDPFLKGFRSLLAEEVRRILSIPFKLSKFDPENTTSAVPAGAKAPIGLTFRLHVDKKSIRRDLSGTAKGRRISPSNLKITHMFVYPDAAGMVAHSKTLESLKKGLFVL